MPLDLANIQALRFVGIFLAVILANCCNSSLEGFVEPLSAYYIIIWLVNGRVVG